ncbi:MAG TPA: trypsin-like peptidase domain-containing protein [Candidatus Acidoferrales bacterium]|jgi:serine protease Do|nr:trypsin-like peptidase domain-containing protein [Candidatus Acidoferrales bacterium]
MESTLVNLSNELAGIVRAVDPHIVSVRARRHYPSSGVLWSPNVVVTADHTIQREEDITVTLADGKTVGATLAGRDSGTDLAVLKVEAPGSSAVQFGRAESLKAGELALVVGRSPDSGVNASLGIISANAGPWRTWRGGQLDAYIRLDAKLFPQSSGGAVVNVRGEIIGIATSALSRIAGVAIPASTVASVTEKLLQKGFMPRGYFGIGVQPVPFSDELRKKLSIPNRSGLIVLTVEPGGPADKAGILIGDIVTGIGDTLIEETDDLQKFSDSGVIGTPVKMNYIRGGALKDSALTVGERARRRN